MGLIELILAATWDHSIGITFGALLSLFSLLGMFIVTQDKWYSTQNTILKVICFIFYFSLALVVLLFIIVHFAGMSSPPNSFPTECGPGHQENCVRLTDEQHFNIPDTYKVPSFATTNQNALNLVKTWVQKYARTDILYFSNATLHSRFLSFFFGFPDDFYAQVVCVNHSARIYLQSQSRLGTGDFGVNLNRVVRFLNFAYNSTLPQGTCN